MSPHLFAPRATNANISKAREGSSVLGGIKKRLGKTLENIQQGTIQNGSLGDQLTVT